MNINLIKLEEEKLNTLTHGLGVLFAVLGLPMLIGISKSQESDLFFGILIYSICFIILFLASTLYHGTYHPKKKHIFHKLDHIAIYFMIAGSYTPFVLKALMGWNLWIFLSLVWLIVLFGTIFKVFYFGKYEKLSLLLYVGMGWLLIFQLGAFYKNLPTSSMIYIIMGGIAYTTGVYFFYNDHKKYYHSIWHLFVLGGSIFHFTAVFLLL